MVCVPETLQVKKHARRQDLRKKKFQEQMSGSHAVNAATPLEHHGGAGFYSSSRSVELNEAGERASS